MVSSSQEALSDFMRCVLLKAESKTRKQQTNRQKKTLKANKQNPPKPTKEKPLNPTKPSKTSYLSLYLSFFQVYCAAWLTRSCSMTCSGQGKGHGCLYLDFRKTFGTVFCSSLLEKLDSQCEGRSNLYWIKIWLVGHSHQRVAVNDVTSSCPQIIHGVPQGSVLFIYHL